MLTLRLPLLAVVTLQLDPVSQAPSVETADGRTLCRMACAACHGIDGKGVPPATLGFDTPLPDFTDCAFSTPEADADWMAVVHQGGTARAFDRRMPAFGDTLSDAAIQRTIEYVRSLCGARGLEAS
jgi:mono/diheme cytochrome c family protein